MDYEAVIFDMDGLLLDTESIGRRAWEQAGRDLGVSVPDDFYEKLIGRTQKDAWQIVRDWLGEDFPTAPYMARANAHYHQWLHEEAPPLKQGVLPLLEFLDELEKPLALATSTSANLTERNLRRTDLARFFRVVVTGDRVARGKPEPDIYLKAAEELGVDPSRCLALEDSVYGVRAAHAARMHVFMVPDQIAPTPAIRAIATEVFPSLREVLQHLR